MAGASSSGTQTNVAAASTGTSRSLSPYMSLMPQLPMQQGKQTARIVAREAVAIFAEDEAAAAKAAPDKSPKRRRTGSRRSRFVFPGDVQRTVPQGPTRAIRQPELDIGRQRFAMLADGEAGAQNMEADGNQLQPALQQLQQHVEERARLNRLAEAAAARDAEAEQIRQLRQMQFDLQQEDVAGRSYVALLQQLHGINYAGLVQDILHDAMLSDLVAAAVTSDSPGLHLVQVYRDREG